MPKTKNLPPDDPAADVGMLSPRDTRLTGLFKTIVESTSAALFIIEDSRFIYSNPAFELLTGYTGEELCLTNLFDLFSAPTPILLAEALTTVDGQSPPIPFEAQLLTKNGDTRWITLTIAPLGDVPGTFLLCTAHDISPFKGKFKGLEHDQVKSGFTAMLLSFAAFLSKTTQEVIQTALQVVQTKKIREWFNENIGQSVQAQRKRFLKLARAAE